MMSDTLARLGAALQDRYTVVRELGAGGMAMVYLAHDIKHERDVAIKVLHPDLGAALGAERFLSEIKTTAKLQHPHILPLLDSGAADGLLYYVMPHVRGETLRARLERERQLPIDDALRIAREVAGALEHAHKQGIIHRDIKPENILLQDGAAVVADFGIALAVQSAGGARMTQTGLSLGTPRYMSPEQAMGERAIDARTDVYALGAVMYEMLAGEPPFTGATAQVVVAKVMSERPASLRAIRDSVSAEVDQAIATALAKTPADRFAGALAFVDALSRTEVGSVVPRAVPPRSSRLLLAGVAASLCTAIAFAALWWRDRQSTTGDDGVVRMVVEQEPGERLPLVVRKILDISPDGSTIAYVSLNGNGNRGVRVRRLADLGSATKDYGLSPVFSPDGSQLLVNRSGELFLGAVQGIAFVRVPGDVTRGIAPTGNTGLVWLDQGHVLIAADSILRVMSVADGTWSPIKNPSGDALRSPIVVPGQRAVVVSRLDRTRNTMVLVRLDLEQGDVSPLGIDGIMALGWVDNALVYATANGELMAVTVDATTLKASGAPKSVATGVQTIPGASGVAYAAISANGHLVYVDQNALSLLVRVGPGGTVTRLLPDTQAFAYPRYSPDGKRIAVDIADPRTHRRVVWVLELATGILSRVTDASADVDRDRVEWSADGKRVIYRVADGRQIRVAMRAIDQDAAEQSIGAGVGSFGETLMATDGRTLLGRVNDGMAQPPAGISTQQVFWWRLGDTTKTLFTQSESPVAGPRLSPDGPWVAYSEAQNNRYQVYITPFPGPGPRIRVNRGTGGNPVWRRDGKALYFADGDAVVEVSLGFSPDPVITGTRVVSQGVILADDRLHAPFDVGPGGDLIGTQRVREPRLIVVRNFASEVRRALRGGGQ